MALKVLLLRKKLTDKQTELRDLEKAAEGFEARETELAADIEAAQTDEERAAVESAVESFEAERSDNDQQRAAIRAGMTGEDLSELDLAYAPPYSSAKDPVNMAGFVWENVRTGLVRQFHWDEVSALPRDGSVTLLDTRTEKEYAGGHIPGAINIPLDSLRERLGEMDGSKPVYVNCYSGLRSYIACRILSGNGFACCNLSGGYRFYALNSGEVSFDAGPRHPCGVKIG